MSVAYDRLHWTSSRITMRFPSICVTPLPLLFFAPPHTISYSAPFHFLILSFSAFALLRSTTYGDEEMIGLGRSVVGDSGDGLSSRISLSGCYESCCGTFCKITLIHGLMSVQEEEVWISFGTWRWKMARVASGEVYSSIVCFMSLALLFRELFSLSHCMFNPYHRI